MRQACRDEYFEWQRAVGEVVDELVRCSDQLLLEVRALVALGLHRLHELVHEVGEVLGDEILGQLTQQAEDVLKVFNDDFHVLVPAQTAEVVIQQPISMP